MLETNYFGRQNFNVSDQFINQLFFVAKTLVANVSNQLRN